VPRAKALAVRGKARLGADRGRSVAASALFVVWLLPWGNATFLLRCWSERAVRSPARSTPAPTELQATHVPPDGLTVAGGAPPLSTSSH
jgi:hypothetical protein